MSITWLSRTEAPEAQILWILLAQIVASAIKFQLSIIIQKTCTGKKAHDSFIEAVFCIDIKLCIGGIIISVHLL